MHTILRGCSQRFEDNTNKKKKKREKMPTNIFHNYLSESEYFTGETSNCQVVDKFTYL